MIFFLFNKQPQKRLGLLAQVKLLFYFRISWPDFMAIFWSKDSRTSLFTVFFFLNIFFSHAKNERFTNSMDNKTLFFRFKTRPVVATFEIEIRNGGWQVCWPPVRDKLLKLSSRTRRSRQNERTNNERLCSVISESIWKKANMLNHYATYIMYVHVNKQVEPFTR